MKPDDIEQWAWDEADDTTYNIGTDGHGSIEYTAARIGIARLVMRVRSQAFEESAKIADEHAFWAGEEAATEPRHDRKMASSAQKFVLTKLSQAIRQHSQKGIVE